MVFTTETPRGPRAPAPTPLYDNDFRFNKKHQTSRPGSHDIHYDGHANHAPHSGAHDTHHLTGGRSPPSGRSSPRGTLKRKEELVVDLDDINIDKIKGEPHSKKEIW